MRTMLKIVSGLLAVLALSVVGYWIGTRLFVRVFAQTDLKVRPYIAEDVQFFEDNGVEVVTAREVAAVRRDGALRKTQTFYGPDGNKGMSVSRIEFPDGYVGMVIDSIRAKATGQKPTADVARAKDAMLNLPPQCAFPAPQGAKPETVDGEETLFGVRAIRVVRDISNGQRYVSWRLPDFACASVQSLTQTLISSSGEWKTVQGKRLTAFAEADPDPRIFTDWSNYAEMKPSDLKRAVYSNSGVTASQCPKCFAEETKSDSTYQDWNIH